MPQFDPENYIDVQERINRFWSEYPDGAIRTYHISDIDNFEHCRYNAEIFKDRNSTSPDATGYAFEAAGGAGANRTSHEENCETSAIGRALANMGYAVTREDRPSRQEMTKVAAPANGKPAAEFVRPAPTSERSPSLYPPRSGSGPTDAQRNFMNGLAKQLGWTIVGPDGGEHHDEAQMNAEVGLLYPGKTIDGLTTAEASAVIEQWQKIQADRRARLGIK